MILRKIGIWRWFPTITKKTVNTQALNSAQYLSLPPNRQDLTQGQWPESRLYWGFRGGEDRRRAETRALQVYACHWPTDEPRWSWAQIWVQARMPDYSLNWTARSSALQGGKRCPCCSSPNQRWPSRSQGPFGLKSALEHWISGTDARQSAEQSAKMLLTLPSTFCLTPDCWRGALQPGTITHLLWDATTTGRGI